MRKRMWEREKSKEGKEDREKSRKGTGECERKGGKRVLRWLYSLES